MEKAKEVIRKSYDDIYETIEEIVKTYQVKSVPINTLENVLKVAKIDNNETLYNFPKTYNDSLDALLRVSTTFCAGSEFKNRLPMVVLKQFIENLKKGI